MTSRRHFLQGAALAAAAGPWPRGTAWAASFHALDPGVDPAAGPDDPVLRELAMRALDAAKAAGATYADVRFTSDRSQRVSTSSRDPVGTVEEGGGVYAGVRALVDGFWGFASTSDCAGDAAARLAREAVAQAKVNNWGATHPVVLDDHPPTATGSWTTPLRRDPFAVSGEEKLDFLHGILGAPEALGIADVTVDCQLAFRRQQKVFAATSGAFLTQTLYWVGPSGLAVTLTDPVTLARSQVAAPLVPLQSGGYECLDALRVRDRLPGLVDEARRRLDPAPAPVGRYDVVFDAHTAAALVCETLGHATELDRVRGYEVNAGGTSYLTEASLGTPVASPLVSVTGSRSVPRGPAAVGWDDDGSAPATFDLVKDGVLVDFATSREYAPALSEWYGRRGAAAASRGCATADDASALPLVVPPDLTLRPAQGDTDFARLVADVRRGVAVLHGDCSTDRERATGQGSGALYEIRDGALGRYLGDRTAFVFRSHELWKNVTALGGPRSAELRGFASTKGEPAQRTAHGAFAVPVAVREVTLIDPTRG